MTPQDDFGIVTRNAELRARYGHRIGHGKARHIEALPTAAAVNPVVRPAAVRRPEPVKPKPPQSQRGRNQYSAAPDRALADAIVAAGNACMADLPARSRERHLIRQSSMFLIYTMARLMMVDIAEMYGFASGDHGPARFAI